MLDAEHQLVNGARWIASSALNRASHNRKDLMPLSPYCKLFDALSSRSQTRAALLWKKIGTLPYKNRELAQNRVNPMQKWV